VGCFEINVGSKQLKNTLITSSWYFLLFQVLISTPGRGIMPWSQINALSQNEQTEKNNDL
jgi:hypothetical protein